MIRLTHCIAVFALLSSLMAADDPCRFEDNAKGVIDLSSLGHTDGTAAFSEKNPPPPSDYSMQLSFVVIMIGEGFLLI